MKFHLFTLHMIWLLPNILVKRIGILYLGKIVEMGKIDEVLLNPKHPYTQALIDAISEPDPENVNKEKKIRINEPTEVNVYEGCRFRARCPYVIDKCNVEPELKTAENEHSFACYVKFGLRSLN